MRRLLLLVALVAACGDNRRPVSDDAGVIDGAIDAPGQQAVGPCLDRPADLPRPPTGALPCDLLPPGSTLTGTP